MHHSNEKLDVTIDDVGDSKVQSFNLYLGCPVWSCAAWAGNFLTADAKQRDFLAQYSTAFNTVEGNSTFYALPGLDTVRRWAAESAPGFRFALKFPREISHDQRLVRADPETRRFLEIARLLQDAKRLGPSFLQLPPGFASHQFSTLETYLRALVKEQIPVALEVRHPDWFDSGKNEEELDQLLTELKVDRVLFDSRPLFSAPPSDPSEVEAQRRKPRTPLRHTVTGKHPFLRLVGRNSLEQTLPWLDEWAPVIANWLQKNLTPYIFTHAPDDTMVPPMARALHEKIRALVPGLPALPPWPSERPAKKPSQQRTLF